MKEVKRRISNCGKSPNQKAMENIDEKLKKVEKNH
jgi:hypothetical protein